MSDQKQSEPIVYRFTPANPGDFLVGVPQRDLTAADVAALDPVRLHDATAPNGSGQTMYTAVKPPKPAKPSGGEA